MAHELYVIKGGKTKNITQAVGNLAWSSNIDALGVELSFDYAYNDTQYFVGLDILELGDHILLYNDGKELHRFVIVSQEVSGRFGKHFNCFDYAWYLNKNETVIQFNKISASAAIKKLLDKVGIKHKVIDIPTQISKIYKEKQPISEIIKDILEMATQERGTKYRMEMQIDTLVIEKQSNLLIDPKVKLSSNTAPFPVASAISNPSRKISIEDMKNKVIAVSSEEKAVKILAESSDPNSIAKFGQLTEVLIVDQKNQAQARNIAKNRLNEANRINEDISLELLGHDEIRAGRLMKFNEPVTGIVGTYLVKSANHTANNGIHKVNVQLGVV